MHLPIGDMLRNSRGGRGGGIAQHLFVASIMARNVKDNDQYSEQETQRRLKSALRGAFRGPPTPLKRIPKKSGESRAIKARSASGANARNAQPET